MPLPHARSDSELVPLVLDGYVTKGIYALARDLRTSTWRVTRLLREAGVKIRVKGRPRTYTHDEHYFDSIDTEAKAYWLGFIFADGCVTTNRLIVNLAEVDAGHLHKLRTALSAENPVRVGVRSSGFGAGGRLASFRLQSRALISALTRHGVVPRKSLTATPPTLAPALTRHFWRGVVDGDGHVCRSGRALVVGLTGSRETCDVFATWVRGITDATARVRPNNTVWGYTVSGSHLPIKLLAVLYEGATVVLDRKAEFVRSEVNAYQSGARKTRSRCEGGKRRHNLATAVLSSPCTPSSP